MANAGIINLELRKCPRSEVDEEDEEEYDDPEW